METYKQKWKAEDRRGNSTVVNAEDAASMWREPIESSIQRQFKEVAGTKEELTG